MHTGSGIDSMRDSAHKVKFPVKIVARQNFEGNLEHNEGGGEKAVGRRPGTERDM